MNARMFNAKTTVSHTAYARKRRRAGVAVARIGRRRSRNRSSRRPTTQMLRKRSHTERRNESENDDGRHALHAIDGTQQSEPSEVRPQARRGEEERWVTSPPRSSPRRPHRLQGDNRSAPAPISRLSPSRTVSRRWGGCSGCSTAVAATASGGATTAPRESRRATAWRGPAHGNDRRHRGRQPDVKDDQAGTGAESSSYSLARRRMRHQRRPAR